MSEPACAGSVAFIGLGMMGLPMASRLVDAGWQVRGSDLSPAALEALSVAGGKACASAREAAEGMETVITMLPDGEIVRKVLTGPDGIAAVLPSAALVIDMSSSAPTGTRRLAEELGQRGIRMVDAPVSGGVKRARDGSLAIMAGGAPADVERARPLLAVMGSSIFPTGGPGSGHAVKALNNYVSAAGLAAACEAAIIAEKFGIDPGVLVDVLNVSTGRNNSTELKMKPFILSGAFNSGFALALMAKDLRTAAALAESMGIHAQGAKAAAKLWTAASGELPASADHTEIYRFLSEHAASGTGRERE